MASHLKATGYPHGRRSTATHCPPDPMGHKYLGSAAQRRLMAQKDQWSERQQERRGRG